MIRVAGYCRVSTDQEDQANSFESQQRYFREYIRSQPDWELYEIYADEGVSGTSTKKRTQFNRMLTDARAGKFRLILTKEVSRFSRNILDTISCTRELKAMGVGVVFMTDRINTLEPEAEMLLSFLASLAQEESRRTSSRVLWGQLRQMERGVVFGPSLLGYEVRKGQIAIEPEGAEIVRLIFQKYAAEQVSTSRIARYLTDMGYRTHQGGTLWRANTIVKILKNEKYAGDLIQRKSWTPDFLTHAKCRNKGDVPLVCIRDHHEPIVSRELWDMAQRRLKQNNKHTKGHSNRYAFSGKIRCGECGAHFVGRFRYLKDGTRIRRWSCATAVRDGAAVCAVGKLVRDDDGMQMLYAAVNALPIDTEAIIRSVTDLALEALRSDTEDPARIHREILRIRKKKEAVLDSCFSGEISREDMAIMNRKYDQQMEALKSRLEQAEQDDTPDAEALKAELATILSGAQPSEVFAKTILDSLTVFKDKHLELRLKHLPQVFRFL